MDCLLGSGSPSRLPETGCALSMILLLLLYKRKSQVQLAEVAPICMARRQDKLLKESEAVRPQKKKLTGGREGVINLGMLKLMLLEVLIEERVLGQLPKASCSIFNLKKTRVFTFLTFQNLSYPISPNITYIRNTRHKIIHTLLQGNYK